MWKRRLGLKRGDDRNAREVPVSGKDAILAVLDDCASQFTFPALNNGYVYPAAARLSAYRASADWALVIEVFGFSPRSGIPDVSIYTFASRIASPQTRADFTSEEAYDNYRRLHPHDHLSFAWPIEQGEWQGGVDRYGTTTDEIVSPDARSIVLRGRPLMLPGPGDYATHGIRLEDPERVHVFELCRYLAATARDDVLATREERRTQVPIELDELLVLDDWRHPDIVGGEAPSRTEAFAQLAEVLVSGDTRHYRPTAPPNTHWSNWPDGGAL
jgi:hypothetical protein